MENNEDRINYKALKTKIWLKDKKEKAKAMAFKALDWCSKNPMAAASLGGAAVAGLKTVRKLANNHYEEVDRRRRFYDPRTGRYTYIRRDLTPAEDAYVTRRFKNGESYSEIFYDMGLIK